MYTDIIVNRLLPGHATPESAYQVDDYPYGYTLRCKIRYWLEYTPKRGFRLWSQTTNPKRPGEVWNKPKASTYRRFGGAMYLDEKDHVQWAGLSEYSTGAEAAAFRAKFGPAVPEAGRAILEAWTESKLAYDGCESADMAIKAAAARKVFAETLAREIGARKAAGQ
jgi:hypothetical protein